MKGKFITLYGINNIGKSTQAALLVKNLEKEGHRVKYLKYPVYDLEPSGPIINQILRDSGGQKVSEDELQLWFVLNRYQFQPELKKLIEDGYLVIAEDYVGTGIAWGNAKGLELGWLEEINKHLLVEDFSILFEGKRQIEAMEKDHVHESDTDLMHSCEKTFSLLADKYGWTRFQVQENIADTEKSLFELVKRFLQAI